MTVERPGTSVVIQTLPTPRSAPTGTGVGFFAGLTDAGPLTPVACYSLADFVAAFGGRFSFSATLYDTLDGYFNEGGNQAWVVRVVGPSAVVATRNLLDSGSGISLVAKAKGPGAGSDTTHGNSLKVAVLAGLVSGFRIQVLDSASNVLETSGDLTTQQDAINWSLYSTYINITLGATALVPAVAAAAALATGTDDRASIVDASWATALGTFGANLGPGQVACPGRTTDVGHQQLVAHGLNNNRVAILDLPDTATAATLEASAVAARTNPAYGSAYTPWLQAPGIIAGSPRVVPPCSLIMALCARSDAVNGNPNLAAAGDNGQAIWFTGLSQTAFENDPTTRMALSASNVNVIRTMTGVIKNYGFRSLVDPAGDISWLDFANCRLAMAMKAKFQAIEENYVFSQLDGGGVDIGHFGAQLTAECQAWWRLGALYGATANEAFFVDVGPSVNTPTNIQNGNLLGVVSAKMSPTAEFVQVAVVKVPITGRV